MNIAMVSEHANPLAAVGGVDAGGQNVHVAALATALAGRGHRVRVYSRRDAADPPERVGLGPGVEVVHVPAGPAEPIGKDELLRHMPAFGAWLAADWVADPPDLVHAHFWMSGLAALTAAREHDLPVVQTFHAVGAVKRRHQKGADSSPPERIRLEAAIARTAALVVATTTDEVRELAAMGMPRTNAVVVPSGVDTDHFGPEGPATPRTVEHRLVSVGRLVPRKGYDLAIRALRGLPDTELVIAGGPPAAGLDADPEAARLRALAARLGVGDRVVLTGQVGRADLPALLRGADLMVCTPWYEPFGITALEAMASGLPVVASAVGGLAETVVDGVTGRLVPPNHPRALAGTLRQLLHDPAERHSYAAGSVDRVQSRYTWERVATATEAAYRRVLTPAVGLDLDAVEDADVEAVG
jgi:D-inositol-3-phosphate glycosyltransferase